ncbi:hypothetical protein AVEN_144682-1 [Araneus ventricosus]|uniref:Uncharacterized protein n=1 Tax=Araneus ventricosus TaxID=182803 RepID=A0A4Y2QBT3_ARAVE|nr:hypothetical protein AVEN_144682-1 [Araneus ventricosus]
MWKFFLVTKQTNLLVVRAVGRDISARATGGTRRLKGHISASHRWYEPSDGTHQREPPVVRAAEWDISVRATGGTRRLKGHISASHRWYAPPNGTYQCEPPVVRAAEWDISVRVTGGTRPLERVNRRVDWDLLTFVTFFES